MQSDDDNPGHDNTEAEMYAIAKLHEWKQSHDDLGRPIEQRPVFGIHRANNADVSQAACYYGYIGTVAAGGAYGCFVFPLIGLPFGVLFAAAVGIVPTMLAFALMLMVGGRLPPASVMAWAGSLTGVGCFATVSASEPYPAPLLVFAGGAGLFGALGARWMTRKQFARFYSGQPKIRADRNFSIKEIMLATAWLAILLTIMQLYVRVTGMTWPNLFIWMSVSLGCTLLVEVFALMLGPVHWRAA